jgi:hypothetical protein
MVSRISSGGLIGMVEMESRRMQEESQSGYEDEIVAK